MEAQLGLIGGTMGLLTGFSILSGVEIVFYLLRYLGLSLTTSRSQSPGFFMSLKANTSEVVSAVGKRYESHLTRKN